MLTYTTYSEAGGVGKSTLTSNLADAHTQQGRDVLTIDLDPQEGSLSYLLGVNDDRDDGSIDNIARHLINRPREPFENLIRETHYGFDIVPSHNMLENLPSLLTTAEELAEDLGEPFTPNNRLREVLTRADIPGQYDTIIVDPPATAGPHLYNAVSTTRSLVLPVEPTGKGIQSIEGIEDVVTNLSAELEIEIGILAVVPNGVGKTNNHDEYLDEIRALGYAVPVAIRDRSSLFEGCWNQQCTAYYYVGHHRKRRREYEVETLDKLRDLAEYIEEAGDCG